MEHTQRRTIVLLVLIPATLWLLAAPPCPELPLAPGTTWTYTARVSWTPAGTGLVRDTTLVWRTSVLSRRTVGPILVATVRDWPFGLAWWDPTRQADTTLVVCRDDLVYHLAATPGEMTALVDSLLAGTRAPGRDDLVLKLPLAVGSLYGRDSTGRDDTFYAWFVEAAEPVGADLRRVGARATDSVVTITYRTLPDHQILKFVQGLGVVGYTYGHHGTVANADARLTRFAAPARQ